MATYRASVTMNYGPVSVTFEIENDTEDGRVMLDKMLGAAVYVRQAHERWAQDEFEKYRLPASVKREDATSIGEETIPLDRLERRTEGEKEMYRAHGGRFSKYGVPLYPDVMKQYPDVMKWSANHKQRVWYLKDASMVVQMVEGKPKRVLSMSIPNGA